MLRVIGGGAGGWRGVHIFSATIRKTVTPAQAGTDSTFGECYRRSQVVWVLAFARSQVGQWPA